MQVFCCVDKLGILCYPNLTPGNVFLFKDDPGNVECDASDAKQNLGPSHDASHIDLTVKKCSEYSVFFIWF